MDTTISSREPGSALCSAYHWRYVPVSTMLSNMSGPCDTYLDEKDLCAITEVAMFLKVYRK